MKKMIVLVCFLTVIAPFFVLGEADELLMDLKKVTAGEGWKTYNRSPRLLPDSEDAVVGFDAIPGNGFAWLPDLQFDNGTIECDVRGQDLPGRSFVGIAFRGADCETYDAVYFRPFNFNSPDPLRRGHGVQYVSHPQYTWQKLRSDTPEKYEAAVLGVSDPNDFFHVTIRVDGQRIRVFVNRSPDPCLEVFALSDRPSGWIGLWMGNNSAGAFKNLRIIKQ